MNYQIKFGGKRMENIKYTLAVVIVAIIGLSATVISQITPIKDIYEDTSISSVMEL